MAHQNNQSIGFRLGFIALLFVCAAAYFSQGCAQVGPAGLEVTQVDPENCDTEIEAEPAACDAQHTQRVTCGKAGGRGVGEAQPGPECMAGPGAPGQVWCCALGPTCDVTAPGVWRFARAADKPGVPNSCVGLGGGEYQCPADACLVVPYTGTCPVCQ
jgi:hypothetical protein